MNEAKENESGYKVLYIIAAVVLLLDIITKSAVIHYIPKLHLGNPPITVIDGFLDIVHVNNKGAAWGILSGYGTWLGLLGILAIVGIAYYRKDLELHRQHMQIAFGMLTGGIIGNIIDRILYGHVIDFIDVYFKDYHWPAFNVADSCITLGVACYIIITFIDGRNASRAEAFAKNVEQ
jgi:signal peptidase II